MPDTSAGMALPAVFDDAAIAEDLSHHPAVARNALDVFRREVERDGGIPFSRLKRCEVEARDGTHLVGCVKTYVPWPTGRYGLVFLPVAHPRRPLALRAFAYGTRHPGPNKRSVYQIAHERRNAQSA